MNSLWVLTLLFILGSSCLAQVAPEPRQNVIPQPRIAWQSYSIGQLYQTAVWQSSNYPSAYNQYEDSGLMISSPSGSEIVFDCTELNIEATSGCAKDAMVLSLTGRSDFSDGVGACGAGTYYQRSKGNSMAIRFYTGRRTATTTAFRFSCKITAVSTTTTTTAAPVTAAPTVYTTTTSSSSSASSTCECGVRNEVPRIVGGEKAIVNEFPWRCVLVSSRMGAFCGGTIISNRWIMTAAHCTKVVLATDELYVSCGDHDLTTATETNNVYIKIDRIEQHANYNGTSQDNDMSLLHLSKDLVFSKTISPACLPWNRQGNDCETAGTAITASGWGTTASKGNSSMVLLKVDLPCISTTECQKYYGSSITSNMLCTYLPGKDTCQGDSGGSIDYKDPVTGRYFAIGVVSWGVGCADNGRPGVYAKTTNFVNWIGTTTGDNSFCKY